MKKILCIYRTIILGMMLILSSCTTYFQKAQSLVPLAGKHTVNLGHVTGSDSAWSILGLWMIGRPDTHEAISKALKNKNGDTLINVSGRETTLWFLLFSVTTVTVEGDAVKIKEIRK